MIKFIELFTNKDLFQASRNTIQPFHIFRKLIEYYQDRLTTTEKVLLYMQFEKFEECLRFAKAGDLHSATMVYNKVAVGPQVYPDFLHNGMLSLFKAMAAYYVYAHSQYDEAIHLLSEGIRHAIDQSHDFVLMTATVQEQWLNIVRVHLRKRDMPNAMMETRSLIAFSLTGFDGTKGVESHFGYSANGGLDRRFWQLEPEIHQLMLNHVMSNVFGGLLRACGEDIGRAGEYYKEIINHAYSISLEKPVIQSAVVPIIILQYYYSGQAERFHDLICREFDAIRRTVPSLQWLILTNYTLLSKQAGVDLLNELNYENLYQTYEQVNINKGFLPKPLPEEASIP